MRRFQLFDEFAGPVTGEQVLKHGRHNQKDHAGKGRARSDDEIAGLAQQRAGVGKVLDKSVVGEDGFGYVSSRTGERFALGEVNPTGAARIIAAQGWDAPAQSVDQATFDRLAQRDDFVKVYRGGPVGLEKGMIEGTPYIGDGKSGPGTYVTDNPDRAARFADKWVQTGTDEAGRKTYDVYNGNVVPMLMPKSLYENAGSGEMSRMNNPLMDHGLNGVGAVTGFMGGDRVVWNTGAMIIGPAVPSGDAGEDFVGRWTLDDVAKAVGEPPTDGEIFFYKIENGVATPLMERTSSPEVIKFAPGLTPVLKHPGHPNQKVHAGRSGAARPPADESASEEDRRRQIENINYIMGRSPFPPGFSYEGLPPPTVTLRQLGREQVAKVRRRVAEWKKARERRALERMSPEDMNKLIAANRARVDAKRAAQGLPPVVYKAMDPVLPLLYDVFRDVVDDPYVWIALIQDERPLTAIDGDLGAILDDMLDAVAPAETVIKFAPGLRPVLKHLSGKHDQKTHGRGGQQTLIDAPFDEWGEDRAPRIRRMEKVGPSAEQIQAAMAYEPDERVISEYIFDAYGGQIEEKVSDYRDNTPGVTDDDVEMFRSDLENEYYRNYRAEAEIYEKSSYEEALREDFAEVYNVSHTGLDRNGRELTITSTTEAVTLDSWDESVKVEGTLRGRYEDGTSVELGRFERTFSRSMITSDGIEVEHDWFRIDEPDARGTGFGREFIQRQEDYYISKGVDRITVHAALEDGGYTWARAGFDWDPVKENPFGSVRSRLNAFIADEEIGPVKTGLQQLQSRLDGDRSSPDYPTPNEIATWGYRDGLSMWPGREIMGGDGEYYGSDWFGQKILTPDGVRQTGRETLPVGTPTRSK